MSTGTLKLASLLIVIAAGGGVAWQAQQGLLRPQTDDAAAASDPHLAGDEGSLDTDIDLLAEANPEEEPQPERWSDADLAESPTPIEGARLASLPDKFQRSPSKSKSSTAIPARQSPRREESNVESQDPFDPGSEPAEEPADGPTPIAMPTLLPQADSAIELPADERQTESDERDNDSSDPFANSESGPVMLVRGSEHDDVGDAPRRRTPPALTIPDDADPEPATETVGNDADPFADSVPPEFGDAPADEPSEDSMPAVEPRPEPELPTELDADPFATEDPAPDPGPQRRLPSLEPTIEDNSLTPEPSVDEPSPTRTPRQRLPSLEPAVEENSLTPKPLIDEPAIADPVPELGSPSTQPPGRVRTRNRVPANLDLPPDVPRTRMRSAPDERDEAPRLLPEPGESEDLSDTGFGDDPNLDPAMDAEPAPRTKRRPSLNDPVTSDELRGDAQPDRAAPTGLQQPRLTIEKVAPKQAVLGQPLIYSVIVKNAGSAAAHQVTVEDRIPKGTKLEGTAPRAELINKSLVWKLGTLKPNEERKISIKVIPQEQGPIGSVAKVNFVAEIAAEIEVTAPQVQLSIDAPSQVLLGEKLKLTYKVRNSGRADAENVVLRNIVPEGLRHPAGADLEYTIGTLAAGDSRDITLDLVATKNGKVENKTIITGDNGINLEQITPVDVVGEQLLLTRTGKNKLFVDRAAIFTSTVANEGTAPAKKVTIAEVVPAGFEFVAASDQGKYDSRTRAVTWSIGPLGPGEEMKLSTKLMPKREGDYRATVTVTGPAGSVATVESDLQIGGFPAVALESQSDGRLIAVGEKATIKISCKNQGTATAKNTILSASLPPELKLVDAKGPSVWTEQGNVVTFEAVPATSPNETMTFELEVEGVAEGDARIELQMTADHLQRPLKREEPIRIEPQS